MPLLHELPGFRSGQSTLAPESLQVGETFSTGPFVLSGGWASELLGILDSITGTPRMRSQTLPASLGGVVGLVKSCLGAAWPDASPHARQGLVSSADLVAEAAYMATVTVRSTERRTRAPDQFRIHLETAIFSAERDCVARHDMVSYWPSGELHQ